MDEKPKFDKLFAFLAEDAGGHEFLLDSTVGGQVTPLIARDVERLVHYSEIARATAFKHNLTVRLVCYSEREDIEVFPPKSQVPASSPPSSPSTHDAACRFDEKGVCKPCVDKIHGVIDSMVNIVRLTKEQKVKGVDVCPLCERSLCDGAMAVMVDKLGSHTRDKDDFLQSFAGLRSIYEKALQIEDWPLSDAAVAAWVKRWEEINAKDAP